jgi:uncharacterized repeat protein (TIGR03803 family)
MSNQQRHTRSAFSFRWSVIGALIVAGVCTTSITSPAQTFGVVYSFTATGSSQDPSYVTPAQSRDGNLYGTTNGFGGGADYGSVFRLTATGSGAELFAFNYADGSNSAAGLTLGTDGNLYGAAAGGGSSNDGVLFRITPSGVYTVLHNFSGGNDGAIPRGAPIQASDGNVYGTTLGDVGSTVYRYTLSSGTFSTIHQFDTSTLIIAPLIQATDGNLYGTADSSGASGCGSIFKMTRAGVILLSFSFPCGAGGSNPAAPLVQAADGNFYGTTEQGGSLANGTIFKMTPKGKVSILYNFKGGSDGAFPDAGLVQATDGMLYGATGEGGSANFGTLFQISTTGSYKSLYSFTSTTGEFPLAALLQHTNGTLYGTAERGGSHGYGAVYSLNMGLGEFVAFVQPSGKVGKTAEILGQGLTGTTSVTFNGVPASSFNIVSDTYLTAIVPAGAATGAVIVATPNGTLTSNKNFQVLSGTTAARKSSQSLSHTGKRTN